MDAGGPVAGKAGEAVVGTCLGGLGARPWSMTTFDPSRRLVALDLDGTLFDFDGHLPEANRRALEELGRRGVARVVATGRSLQLARLRLPEDFPIDWLVYSSGAGRRRWPDGDDEPGAALSAGEIARAVDALGGLGLDFSVHETAPDTHRFLWRDGSGLGTDFHRRLERHREHGRPLDGAALPERASQLLAMAPPEGSWPRRVAESLPGLRVIHSTSPLDGRSLWIEVLPAEAGKGRALADLCRGLEIGSEACLALGNDWNDLDLLEWAGHARVMSEAPAPLRRRFGDAGPCAAGAVGDEILRWLDDGLEGGR